MAGRIRALLVGIDDYLGDVPKLAGCGNDVAAMEGLLTTLAGDRLDLRVLRDREATRAAVVAAFSEHLGHAEPQDVALFYYSGHGSNEPAPEELWAGEPDRRSETLVCVDSRTDGERDLADRELATLVAQASAGGAHVLVMLDCCHSGSGARGQRRAAGQAVRQAPADTRPRTMDTYLVPVAPPAAGARARTAGGSATRTMLSSAPARYVLMAGCEASQTSKEQTIDGRRRGVFTLSLETALRSANGRISYADLLSWATTRVRARVSDQTPQLEVTEEGDRSLSFLGGEVSAGGHHLLLHTDDGWGVDAGALHGIPEPRGDETVGYAVYPQDATAEDRRTLAARVADAAVTSVGPTRSLVTVEPVEGAALDEDAAYLAVPVAWPVPAMRVAVTGEPAGVELVTAALAGGPGLTLADGDGADADILVRATDERLEICDGADGTPLTAPLDGLTAETAAALVGRLERIARWRRVRDLANPQSGLAADEVVVEITLADGTPAPPGEIVLDQPADGATTPGVRVTVHNRGREAFFVGVLGLTSQLAVVNLLEPSPGEWVQPGGALPVAGGAVIGLEVPEVLYRRGVTEVTDHVTVLVSTAAFDAGTLTQPELDAPARRAAARTGAPVSTLDALLRRVGTRGFVMRPREGAVADWTAWTRTIVTRRPASGTGGAAGPRGTADAG